MTTIEEKRVFGEGEGATEVFVASGVGVVAVSVSGASLGEFGLVRRCTARDVAAGERVAVATDEDVLVLGPSDPGADPEVVETGFGPATAVGYDGGDHDAPEDGERLLAAAPDGRVARLTDGEWRGIEPAPERRDEGGDDVRAIDGGLVATAGGVYRAVGDRLEASGLSEVRDVASGAVPLAATDDGLYRLGNGWMRVLEGAFDVVSAASADASGDSGPGRAHAVSGLAVYERDDGEWVEWTQTSVPVVDIAYGDTVYAVTGRGTFLAADEDGWRSRSLGVGEIAALAVPDGRKS